jgi:hypothetical protein
MHIKFLLALVAGLLVCGVVHADGTKVVPVPSADAKDARDLGKQVRQLKHTYRAEKASAYRRYKAKKLEGRAGELRAENAAADKALHSK